MIKNILIALISSVISCIAIFYVPLSLLLLFLVFFTFVVLLLKSFFYGYSFIIFIFWSSFVLNKYIYIQIFNQKADLQFLIVLILVLFFPFTKYFHKLSNIYKKNKYVVSAFICFIIISSISTYISSTPYSLETKFLLMSTVEIFRYIAWLTIFIISIYVFQNSENRQKFLQYVSVFVILISIAALTEYLVGYNLFIKDAQEYGVRIDDSVLILTRAKAVFNHPNMLGTFLILTFPLLVFNILNEKRFKNKILPIVAVGILPLALLVTFSRTAWITALLIVITMFLIFIRNKNYYLILLSIAFIIVAAILIFNNKSLSPEINIRLQADAAVTGRMLIWKGLWEKTKDRKLVGYGLYSTESYLSKQIVGRPMAAHSDHLKALVESGYIGFIAYASIFMALVFKYLRIWIKSKGLINIFALIVIFSYLFAASSTMNWEFRASFFFVILAFIENISREQQLINSQKINTNTVPV